MVGSRKYCFEEKNFLKKWHPNGVYKLYKSKFSSMEKKVFCMENKILWEKKFFLWKNKSIEKKIFLWKNKFFLWRKNLLPLIILCIELMRGKISGKKWFGKNEKNGKN